MTLDIYSHVVPGLQEAAARSFDDMLKINPPLYMIGKKISCWWCESRMSVITLLTPSVDGTEGQICVLPDIDNPSKSSHFYSK